MRRHILTMLTLLALLATTRLGATAASLNPQSPISSLPASLTSRPWAPVVLKPADLPDVAGAPITNLAVWAWRAGRWQVVPRQVDEVTAGVGYVARGDGVFDGEDELVFMLPDGGENAPALPPLARAVYRLAVSDPLAPDAPATVFYITRLDQGAPSFTQDYVRWDAQTRRLTGETYVLGLDSQRPLVTYLTLNGFDVDLVDRTKVRAVVNICLPACLTLTEDDLPLENINPIIDGPVRVVLDEDGDFAYATWASLSVDQTFNGLPRLIELRVSVDLSAEAQGATYRDENVPGGVTVDGTPDTVPATPVARWRQIDHPTGRMVNWFTIGSNYSELQNYYLDRGTVDNDDTGDKRSYGDSGLVIVGPSGQRVAVETALWALPRGSALDGPTLAAQLAAPLTQTITREEYYKLYLPYIQRGD